MRLTRDEIYLVVFILTALVLGSVVQHWRQRDQTLLPATSPPVAQP